MRLPHFGTLLFCVWSVVVFLLAWSSYVFLDGNLTLIGWQPYVSWQTLRWSELLRPDILARQYFSLIVVWWATFLAALSWIRKQSPQVTAQFVLLLVVVAAGGLLAGHNAHSRDIYNYLFNAKMVTTYQADPHVQTALDFSSDPWIRFMHNVHTPAPYGYGWTLWSLIPFIGSGLGGSFLLSYLAMRGWMYLGWLCLLLAVWWGLKFLGEARAERWWRFSLIALHPLLLMEALLNGHNDVWMMAPAILAWGVILSPRKNWHWFAIAGLLLFSVFMKYATVLIWPIFAALLCIEVALKYRKTLLSISLDVVAVGLKKWGADVAMLAMLVPLFTERSQQFHPWYAAWFLAWLPFGRLKLLRWVLLGLSFTSQLRYLPWIEAGLMYTPEVQWQMRAITWSGAVIGLVAYGVWKLIPSRK